MQNKFNIFFEDSPNKQTAIPLVDEKPLKLWPPPKQINMQGPYLEPEKKKEKDEKQKKRNNYATNKALTLPEL